MTMRSRILVALFVVIMGIASVGCGAGYGTGNVYVGVGVGPYVGYPYPYAGPYGGWVGRPYPSPYRRYDDSDRSEATARWELAVAAEDSASTAEPAQSSKFEK